MSTVQNILDRKGSDVASIEPSTTALEAARRMNDKKIGSLVVLSDEKMTGIVTERDILRRVVAQGVDPKEIIVEKVMTTDMLTCTPDTSLEQVRDLMSRFRVRRLPVLIGDKLAGIVTIGDVMYQTILDRQELIDQLNEYMGSPPTPAG